MKIYVASSWRNKYQPEVVQLLRDACHNVYDFRNPAPDDDGFRWLEIDPNWESWREHEYIEALKHPIADRGFNFDWSAMVAADACVLVLPSGRSAHIEAGYFVGAGKPLLILIPERCEPELMYKMADGLFTYMGPLIERLNEIEDSMPGIRGGSLPDGQPSPVI